MIWLKKNDLLNLQELKQLAQKYKISLMKATVLSRRGIKEEDFIYYLEDDIDKTHNPYLFEDMEKFVNRLTSCLEQEERILIFGDRDADGITATSILLNYLRREKYDVRYRLPQGDDSYGLTMDAIKGFAQMGGTLIITIDCGISNIAEIEYANSIGIDVMIVDHHNIKDAIPPAYAIVNPKMPNTTYPFAGLCSGALASKVVQAMEFAKTDAYAENMSFLTLDITLPKTESEPTELEFHILNCRNFVIKSQSMYRCKFDKRLSYSELFAMILSKQIYIYKPTKEQVSVLESVFSNDTSFLICDVSTEADETFPKLKKYDLSKIKQKSIYCKYNPNYQNVNALMHLFEAMVSKKTKCKEYHKSILDIVAISTVSDMMPLTNENRLIIKYGMPMIKRTTNNGLTELVRLSELESEEINEDTISWKITPLINSTGRMGEPHLAVELLTAKDGLDYIVSRIDELNNQRKKMSAKAWNLLEDKAFASYNEYDKKFIAIVDNTIIRGIISMLAIKIMQKFEVPTMIIAQAGDKMVGSMRSSKSLDFKVPDFLSNFADIFVDYGGHDLAGGFNLPSSDMETFTSRMKEVVSAMEIKENSNPQNYFDLKITPDYLDKNYGEFYELYQGLAPYGKDFDPIIFKYEKAKIYKVDIIQKTKTSLKYTFKFGDIYLSGMAWDIDVTKKDEYKSGDVVDLYFSLKKELYYKEMKYPNIEILHIEKID